jgi:hypothetical protein
VDGRDGTVEFARYPLSIPAPLRTIIEMYQNDMKVVSFNQALRMLLESHPEIDKRVRRVYAEASNPQREDQPA